MSTVAYDIAGLVATGIFAFLGLVYLVVAGFIYYKLLLNKPSSFIIIALVSFVSCSFFAFFVAVAFASFALKKKRDELHSRVYAGADDSVVRELIEFYTNFSITNRPEEWQGVRNVWHAVNGSKNVSSELKKQLLGILLTKGLFLSEAEKRIRD